jgi:hypothetical protein
MATTFFPACDGGTLARCGYAERDDDIRQAVQCAPETIWTILPFRFRVGARGVLVFDSAYAGDDLPLREDGRANPWLELALADGLYQVELAELKSDKRTWLILVRLSLMSPCDGSLS